MLINYLIVTLTVCNSFCKMRGALIVFEGGDRCGKTTQCKRIVSMLKDQGIPAEFVAFPDRETATGRLINDYLTKKVELPDRAVHLLFTANRWELVPKMKNLLNNGTTLLVDRYSFSGVAFTAAKKTRFMMIFTYLMHMSQLKSSLARQHGKSDDHHETRLLHKQTIDFDWCKTVETGLPKPDLVLLFKLSLDIITQRRGWGNERYERSDFQLDVADNFQRLFDKSYWMEVDANNKSIDELTTELMPYIQEVMKVARTNTLKDLW